MKKAFIAFIYTLLLSISLLAQNAACPKIEVVGGGVVQPGEPMNFSVKLSDDAKNSALEYEWTVTAGTISGGQGTSSITVDTTGLTGQNITAEVSVKGLSETCAKNASETGSVASKPIGDALDYFGKLTNDDVKARVDALFVTLGNEPNSLGYVLVSGTEKEMDVREWQIQRAINFRKYDPNRVKIAKCGANPSGGVWTIVWIVPPGAEFPVC